MLFIDSLDTNLQFFQQSLEKLDYKGKSKYFTNSKEAIDFLKISQAAADLIFCTYDMKTSAGLQLFDDLTDYHKQLEVPIEAKIVVCSRLSLDTFKKYVMKRGATGFLLLPLQLP